MVSPRFLIFTHHPSPVSLQREGTAKQVATTKMTSIVVAGLKMTSELLMSSAEFLQSMQDSAKESQA